MYREKSVYCGFTKKEKQSDGTIKVWGFASSEAVDSDGDIIRASAMEGALPGYMKFGNIREMHGASAAGVAFEASVDDATKKTFIGVHVVDPIAVKKVETGTYKGFSIGGSATHYEDEECKIIDGLMLNEISLVDRPANPDATFTLWKAKGMDKQPTATEQVDELASLLNGGEISIGDVLKMTRDALEKKKKKNPDAPAGDGGTGQSPADAASEAQLGGDDDKSKTVTAEETEAGTESAAATANEEDGNKTKKADEAGDLTKGEKLTGTQVADNNGTAAAHPEVGGVVTLREGDFTTQATVVDLTDGMYTLNTATMEVKVNQSKLVHPDAATGEPNWHVTMDQVDGRALLAEKAVKPGTISKRATNALQKGFYDIQDMACLLNSLKWLISAYSWEQDEEDGTSATLPKLKQWMSDGVVVLETMVAEEVAEYKAGTDVELALDSGMVQKFLLPALQKAAKLPAAEGAALQKAVALVPVTDTPEFKEALTKAVATATKASDEKFAALEKRLKQVEDTPAAPRGVTKAITKGSDIGEGPEQAGDDVVPVKYNGEVDPVATAIKKAHATPGTFVMGGAVHKNQ